MLFVIFVCTFLVSACAPPPYQPNFNLRSNFEVSINSSQIVRAEDGVTATFKGYLKKGEIAVFVIFNFDKSPATHEVGRITFQNEGDFNTTSSIAIPKRIPSGFYQIYAYIIENGGSKDFYDNPIVAISTPVHFTTILGSW